MRLNFKKVSAIATSALMLSLTMGTALAANYPAPFVAGGAADVAVVYGTGSGVSSLDLVQAGNLQSDLSASLGGTGGTTGGSVSGGDYVKFEKTSSKFHLGTGVLDVRSTSVTDDDMDTLLKDEIFVDDDNDEFDYTQKIEMANSTLTVFEDSDYKDDEPSVGIRVASGTNILNYTLDFTENPIWTDLETSDLTIMGKTYYILDTNAPATNTSITFLDSAEDTVLTEGETTTITGHSVSISFIDSDEVKLTVDGDTTNSLNEGETQKLADGSYVGVKDILFNSKDTGVSSVEFSIGKGKLVLTNGQDVELNEDNIDGLSAVIVAGNTLTDIKLVWTADEDLFVTPDSAPVFPGFETVKLSFTGMVMPHEESLKVNVDGDLNIVLDDFPLKDSTEDIEILQWNSTSDAFSVVGKDSTKVLLSTNTTNLTYDASDFEEWMVVSWSDGDDAESYLVRATNFQRDSTADTNKTTFEYRKNGVWADAKVDAENGDSFTIGGGNAELFVGAVNHAAKEIKVWGGTNVAFNVLYSKEGAKVYLPYFFTNGTSAYPTLNISNTTMYASELAACAAAEVPSNGNRLLGNPILFNKTVTNATTGGTCLQTDVQIVIAEEDKDGNIQSGQNLTVTLNATSDEVEVTTLAFSGASGTESEILSTDVFRNFAYSALASETLFSKPTGSQKTLEVKYHGGESYGELFLTDVSATVTGGVTTGGSALGDVLVKDSEVSTVSSKNLIVVGGSCINTVAASLLGSGCGSDFTDKTGIGSGQFLIESMTSPYASNQIALVVAGYEAADTVNAATYLKTKTVDTTVGKKYKGTSSTSAELVVE